VYAAERSTVDAEWGIGAVDFARPEPAISPLHTLHGYESVSGVDAITGGPARPTHLPFRRTVWPYVRRGAFHEGPGNPAVDGRPALTHSAQSLDVRNPRGGSTP
jgi:hypothetical protein